MEKLRLWFEMLGGSRDLPPAWANQPWVLAGWGLWWGLLAAIILTFSGQTSKFIYIDF